MSEEEIEEFIAITATSRRCALWFISHNSDLNEAVESFYENGEGSIPDDFDPDNDDDFPDFGCEEEEEDSSENIEIQLLPEVSFEPTISPIQINQVEETEEESVSPQQIIKKKIAEGSKLTYVLQNIPESNVRKPFFSHTDFLKNKKFKFKPRNNAANSIPFVLWKNGFSVGNVFTQKNEAEMQEILNRVSHGIVPSQIPDITDIQLVDKTTELYDSSFDYTKVLIF